MEFIEISSNTISEDTFERYKKEYGYAFSPSLRKELREAFFGKVSLIKFRPFKENSLLLVLQSAKKEGFTIPTCKEWSAILLAADTMAKQGNQKAELLLNHNKDGMLKNELEITSTALFYLHSRKFKFSSNKPTFCINKFLSVNEDVSYLSYFPQSLGRVKEIKELGLPANAYVVSDYPAMAAHKVVLRGSFASDTHRKPFDVTTCWPLDRTPLIASRLVKPN